MRRIGLSQGTETKSGAGLTLIEILVSVAIFVTIATLGIIGYRRVQQNKDLAQSNAELASNIRQVENFALTGQQVEGATPRGGFGVHLSQGGEYYSLFADTACDAVTDPDECNYRYDEGGDQLLQSGQHDLLSGVTVGTVVIDNYSVVYGDPCAPIGRRPGSSNVVVAAGSNPPCELNISTTELDLVFKPPKPQLYIYYEGIGSSTGLLQPNDITICLGHSATGSVRSVKVKVGPLGKVIVEENLAQDVGSGGTCSTTP